MYTRRDKRKHIRSNVSTKIKTHSWQKGIDQGLINISKGGCKLITNLIYDIGDIIILSISDKYIVGTVKRKNHCGYGIKFIKQIIGNML